MSYYLFWKLTIILTSLLIPFVSLYLRTMLHSWKHRHVFMAPSVLFVGYALAAFVLPMHVFAKEVVMYSLMGTGLLFLLGTFVMLLAAYLTGHYGDFQKTELQTYILAILCLNVVYTDDVFYVNAVQMTNTVMNLGRILFDLLIAFLLAQRLTRSSIHLMGLKSFSGYN